MYRDYYDRAVERARSKKGRYYKTLRHSTVEPVFGDLINFLGMRKINTHGIENANKAMLMAAMAYNLKKLMKYRGRPNRAVLRVVNSIKTQSLNLMLQISFISRFLGQIRKNKELVLVIRT